MAEMIASLRGKIAFKTSNSIVLDVNGVGYEVFLDAISLARLKSNNEEIALHIETVLKEDTIQLIGFIDALSKEVFKLLLTVQGIGIKAALAILSSFEAEEVLKIIREENIGKLSMVSGIGKKTGERIILELRDKVKKLPIFYEVEEEVERKWRDLRSALLNLDFKLTDIERVLNIIKDSFKDESLEELLKKSLRELRK